MAETTSKRRKAEENDGGDLEVDRISSLPDSVLLHILSFLNTGFCVRVMSLVSRRWLHLWKHLQVFHFYDEYDKDADQPGLFQDFAVFVNAVLALRKCRDIRKMRLFCTYSPVDPFYANSVDTWIRTAIGPHLEELHLALFSYDGHAPHLPLTILTTCTNLVSFSLCGGEILLQLERHSAIRLPSLKTLQIDMGWVDVTYVDAILSGCPILETLELSFSPKSLTTLRVPHSLKRLKFTVENDVGTYLQIDAPGLKYLSLTNITFRDNAVCNLHKVDEAYLDVFSPPGESVSVNTLLNLFRALSGVKHLVLRCSTIKWLFGAPIDIKLDFPEFRHLLHLELILVGCNTSFMFEVLPKCPMLQALIIQNDKDLSWEDLSPHSYIFVLGPKRVPNCLKSHLTFFHIKGCGCEGHDLNFPGQVLRNGLVLETMLISGVLLHQKEKWEKYRILEHFSETPRGSAICQLKFD